MMGFDTNKFEKTEFQHREEEVKIRSEALKSFFDSESQPVFRVRGLTGEEMARVNEAETKQSNLSAIVEALATGGESQKVEAIRQAVGLAGDDVPADYAKRIETVSLGCIDPELDEQMTVKIFEVAAADAYNLSNKIWELSGQGLQPGEPRPSGGEETSKQHSTSATPGGECSTS